MELAGGESHKKVVLLCLIGLGIAFLRMSAGCVCKTGKCKLQGFCPDGGRFMSLRLAAGLFNSAVSLGQTHRGQTEFEQMMIREGLHRNAVWDFPYVSLPGAHVRS